MHRIRIIYTCTRVIGAYFKPEILNFETIDIDVVDILTKSLDCSVHFIHETAHSSETIECNVIIDVSRFQLCFNLLGEFPGMDSEFRARIRGLEWFARRARKMSSSNYTTFNCSIISNCIRFKFSINLASLEDGLSTNIEFVLPKYIKICTSLKGYSALTELSLFYILLLLVVTKSMDIKHSEHRLQIKIFCKNIIPPSENETPAKNIWAKAEQ
ncbi:hypothetical protein AGLY_006406 [Aphis glycines]|uniref:Uncharacterized protein n=1 Tax=Aphis glycines TaxID=307491 RepID=A0A6G0TR57_APHGL|nr:hypothetical protein AGLY_006406 [Aphis glycines]